MLFIIMEFNYALIFSSKHVTITITFNFLIATI